MSKKKKRRYLSPEQKVAILREHLIDRRPISDVCEVHDLQPSVFYDWQRKFFENGAAAFTTDRNSEKRRLEWQVEQLRDRLNHKDHVIARVTEELVKEKNSMGGPEWPVDSPRHPRPGRRLRHRVDRLHRPVPARLRRLARHPRQQVLGLEEALRQGQRTQRRDPSRSLAAARGDRGHRGFRPGTPPRRLPAADLHDERR